MPALRATIPWLGALPLLLGGCVTHAERLRQVRAAFYEGDLVLAEQLVDKALQRKHGDAEVLQLEKAMIQLADGRPGEAEQTLREVRDRLDYFEQTNVAEKAVSLLTDDQRTAYAGEDYERVLVRSLLALANLVQGGDDAEAYSLQISEKQQQIIERAVQPDGTNPKSAYQQVALGPYLRAVLREQTHRDYDDVARQLAMVVSWEPQFEPGAADLDRARFGRHSDPGHGVLYVFALVGRGPYKEEADEVPTSAALLIADRIISATGDQTLPPTIATIKVPRVAASINVVQSVGVDVNGTPRGRTATITDVTRMAIAQQEALYPHVMARAIVRRATKKSVIYGTKQALGVQKGSIESLPLDLAGVVWEATERADTRCWGLLPAGVQVLRLELPAGEHHLTLRALDAHGRLVGSGASARAMLHDGRNTYLLATIPGPKLVGRILVSD